MGYSYHKGYSYLIYYIYNKGGSSLYYKKLAKNSFIYLYLPKDIYLDQLNLIDNRLIYADKSLATYIQNDKMEIKARKLGELNLKKQQLLYELEMLKNGQT